MQGVYSDAEVRSAVGRWAHLCVFPEGTRPAMAALLGLMPTFDAYARAFIGFGMHREDLNDVVCASDPAGMVYVQRRTTKACSPFVTIVDNIHLVLGQHDDYIVGEQGCVTREVLDARRGLSSDVHPMVVGLMGMQVGDVVGGSDSDDGSVGGYGIQQAGYCYLEFIVPDAREEAAGFLGAFPSVELLLNAPAGWYRPYEQLHNLEFRVSGDRAWHVERRATGGVPAGQALAFLAGVRRRLGHEVSGSFSELIAEHGEEAVRRNHGSVVTAQVSSSEPPGGGLASDFRGTFFMDIAREDDFAIYDTSGVRGPVGVSDGSQLRLLDNLCTSVRVGGLDGVVPRVLVAATVVLAAGMVDWGGLVRGTVDRACIAGARMVVYRQRQVVELSDDYGTVRGWYRPMAQKMLADGRYVVMGILMRNDIDDVIPSNVVADVGDYDWMPSECCFSTGAGTAAVVSLVGKLTVPIDADLAGAYTYHLVYGPVVNLPVMSTVKFEL